MGVPLTFVLVRPRRAANVGACARAMKNFGHSDLRIVEAPEVLPGGTAHGEARALAWNAHDVLDGARALDSLRDAVGDLRLVAATSSRDGDGAEVMAPREFAAEAAALPAGARAGVVLGPEDSGLSNDELGLCRVRVRIPTGGPQPSLNLAQAAVILAYEAALAPDTLSLKGSEAEGGSEPLDSPSESWPAAEEDVERLVTAARALLLRAGYLNPQAPEHVLGELRRLLARARPSAREVQLLQGLVAQLDWAHRHRP